MLLFAFNGNLLSHKSFRICYFIPGFLQVLDLAELSFAQISFFTFITHHSIFFLFSVHTCFASQNQIICCFVVVIVSYTICFYIISYKLDGGLGTIDASAQGRVHSDHAAKVRESCIVAWAGLVLRTLEVPVVVHKVLCAGAEASAAHVVAHRAVVHVDAVLHTVGRDRR